MITNNYLRLPVTVGTIGRASFKITKVATRGTICAMIGKIMLTVMNLITHP